MNPNNLELLKELEKRIKSSQITLEVQPDTVKECAWSDWRSQFFLKTQDYSLNLTQLFEEMEKQKTQTSHCNCSSCHGQDFFTFLFKNLKLWN